MKKIFNTITLFLLLTSGSAYSQVFNIIHINPMSATFVFDYSFTSSYWHEDTYTGDLGLERTYNDEFDYFSVGVQSGSMTFEVSSFENPFNEVSYMFSAKHRLFDMRGFQTDFGLGLATKYDKDLTKDAIFVNDNTMLAFVTDFRYEDPIFKTQRFSIIPHIKLINLDTVLFNLEFNYIMY